MAATPKGVRFWNRFANRYAARPIKDTAAYEALLADVAGRLRPTDHVLEIGCGTGGTAIRLAPVVGTYRATDFSTEMIRIAREKMERANPAPANLRFDLASAETAFDGSPFDAICAFNVLHLVEDLSGMLREIHHRLRPGGLLISKTWCFADLGRRPRLLFGVLKPLGLFPPARFLTEAQLRQMLQDAGFVLIDHRVFGTRPQNPYLVSRKPA